MNSKVSIIVSIYNIEKYLVKCLRSITNQTYTNIEIILIDDGSTDTSGEICDYFANNDKRIVVKHKKNGGLVSARKTGLKKATGSYVVFVDGDDWIEYNMIESLLKIAVDNDADFVDSGFYEEKEESGVCIERPLKKLIENSSKDIIGKWLCQWMNNSVRCSIRSTIWSKIYKTPLIKASYSFVPKEMSLGEDYINFITLLYLIQNKVCVTSEIFYHYRNRNNSLCHNDSFNYYVNNQDLYAYMRRLIKQKFPFLAKEVEEWRMISARDEFARILSNNKIISERPMYHFPNIDVLFNKRIVLYGAGAVGRDYYSQIVKYEKCQIIAWVDQKYFNYSYEYYNIKPIDFISDTDFDLIIISVLRKELANSIRQELISKRVPEEKIIWKEPLQIKFEIK